VELVCYRGAIGIVFMATWCHRPWRVAQTPVPMMHVWRSIVGVASLTAWFYAIAKLPLATAMTLNYMSGIWVAAFLVGGTMIMGRLQDVGRQGPIVLTVMAGFTGVIMMLRPTMEQNQLFAGLIGLLSGLGAAFAYLQVAALGRVGEPEARTVLYFSVGATVAGAIGMLFIGHQRLGLAAGLVAAADRRTGRLGQLCMTRAYSQGATLVVANLQYSGIVFAALFGVVLFGDQIPRSAGPAWR
jgi:S-adenosylmethionine uptake transporter